MQRTVSYSCLYAGILHYFTAIIACLRFAEYLYKEIMSSSFFVESHYGLTQAHRVMVERHQIFSKPDTLSQPGRHQGQ